MQKSLNNWPDRFWAV